jgi:CRP/FNR family transcriptional regulator, cyclic AMP receptor protein
MCDVYEAREIVARQGWLSRTPAPFRQQVLDRTQLQDLKAGDGIYSVGDPPGGMYGLVSGGLAISIAPGERGPLLAHFVQPGTWLGEAAAFTEQARQIGLTVTRDTQVLHLPLHSICEIVALDPGAWRFFGLAAIAQNSGAIGAADDLLIRDHVKRCIAVLLRLGGCRIAVPPASMPIDVDVNQQGLATMSNLSRTTAGSILRRFEASGHLEVSYRHIRILAPDALRAMLVE